MSTRTVYDPFLAKEVQVSNNLTDRLRGRYACGPTMPNGEPEFGWREFPTPPVQAEAADHIERLQAALAGMLDSFGGYCTKVVDAAIAAMQVASLDRWSMQSQMERFEIEDALEQRTQEPQR